MNTNRTTPAQVNRALAAAGLAVEIVRDRAGYYWFDDATTAIPSIGSNSLRGYTTDEIVAHVRKALETILA